MPVQHTNQFQPSKDHLLSLDGLRGLAVLLVLWGHTPRELLGGINTTLAKTIQPGYLGVDIFFVLSGFLITRILLADRHKPKALKNFLIRRFLRIFPIYYLTIFVLLFVFPGEYLLYSFFYLSNYYFAFVYTDPELFKTPLSHGWSLAVEEHYYLVWPLVVMWLPVAVSRRIALWVIIPLAILSAIVTILIANPELATELIYRGSHYRAMSLSIGAMFAYHERWLRAHPARLWLIVAAFVLPAFVIVPAGKFIPALETWYPLAKMLGFGVLSAGVVLAILAIDAWEGPVKWLFSNAPVRYIGRISYGLYLYHFPIFILGFGLREGYPNEQTPTLTNAALAWAITFAVASASFFLIERPLLKLKNRYRTTVPSPEPAAQPGASIVSTAQRPDNTAV